MKLGRWDGGRVVELRLCGLSRRLLEKVRELDAELASVINPG
jgi:hypothetical protein